MKSSLKRSIGEVVTDYGTKVMRILKKRLQRSLFDFYGDVKADNLRTREAVNAPTTPVDGDGGIIYTKSADGKLYYKSNEVAEVELSASDTVLTSEQVQDIVGGMLVGTETRIGVTYDDTNGRIDFVVDDMTADTNTQNTTTLSFVDSSDDILLRNTTGGAGSGTDDIKFVAGSNVTLTHTDADNITIASTDTNTTYSEATGSAEGLMSIAHHDKLDGIEASATADQTQADINSLNVTAASCSGNAATATALATARAINGVDFDGTAPITITAAGSTLSDTVTVAKGGTGATTLTSNALLTGNGTSAIQAESDLTFTSGTLILSDSNTSKPIFQIKSTGGFAHIGGSLDFITDEGNAGASGDVLGRVRFIGDNADQDVPQQTYAQIQGKVDVATDGEESGILELQVANHDDDLGTGLTLTGGSTNDEIDVTVGLGSSSLTTIVGDLQVDGNDIKDDDGTTCITFDSSGNTTIAGTTSGTFSGNLTGNASGSSGSCTGQAATVATIAGLAPNTATTAAAQPNITSLHSSIAITKQVKVTLSTANCNALHTTPIELVAAQGANTVIVPTGGMIRIDRASTQSNSSADVNIHYEDKEPGAINQTALAHFRRFMYNESGDRVFHIIPAMPYYEVSQNLTDDVNKAVEISVDSAFTTNCFTSIDIYLTYNVFDIS